MESSCTFISFESTGYFSKIVTDYIRQAEGLRSFYQHPVSLDGIKAAIEARKKFPTNRTLLVEELHKQYDTIDLSAKQEANLKNLLHENTFTVTTAHQPNIFTGPLYFIYKIMHAVKLADELKAALPLYHFVPVYYMGSEDADLDELGYLYLNQTKLSWHTKQTGAVGRMKVDRTFIQLIEQIYGQVGVHPNGKELTNLFRKAYAEGKMIQQATLELVNALFAEYGLLIVVPDNEALKRAFNPVVEKELTEQFSHKAVEQTIHELGKNYKVQTAGRDLNLFYLIDDKRERIEFQYEKYFVQGLGQEWSREEILAELNEHPERFSGNVILRGVFQETILPNIAFIGGGGELAYWLELKGVFEAAGVPYPMLIVRNSFLYIETKQWKQWNELNFSHQDLFRSVTELLNEYVKEHTENQIHLTEELAQANALYEHLKQLANKIDATLEQHTEALQVKTLQKLQQLEKKLLRAEKRKFSVQQQHVARLKNELFPHESLQERIENFSSYYARFGSTWLQDVYQHSKGLDQQFGIIRLH